MDRLEKSASNNEDGFIKTVFPFDEDQKGLLLNIIQYAVLAIIPIIILLKLIIDKVLKGDMKLLEVVQVIPLLLVVVAVLVVEDNIIMI